MIAGIETSSARSSIAVLAPDGTVTERVHEAPRGHVEFCLPALLELLGDAGLSSLTAIGIGIGPGAFTGLRVGVQTAKTLAHLGGWPLVPISSLEALAAAGPGEGTVLACMHAFRGEVSAALFERTADGAWIRRTEDDLLPPAAAAELAASHGARIVGTGPSRFPDAFGTPPTLEFPSASTVARLAAGRLDQAVDALSLEPRYLRRSEAEIRWGDTGVVAKRPDRIRFRKLER